MARSSSAPDGNNLWRQVSAADRRRVGSWNRGGDVNINPTEYAATAALGPVKSPFSAIPLAAQTAEFGYKAPAYEMMGFFGDDLEDEESQSMEYYAWNEEGYLYDNLAENVRADELPAPITIIPTSTINPERPRTVAAGYDSAQRKLTVIFRDGTYYNYFEVPASEWNNFKRARSKGRFILAYLDTKPRGPADVMAIPVFARETVYRFLRTGQYYRGGTQPGMKPGSRRGGGYKSGNLGGTGRARLKKSQGQTGGSGVTMPRTP
jgi:hypothetical protein